jgi:8-oxo-dGTP pyrophosphatase MutT (NUDIX family)
VVLAIGSPGFSWPGFFGNAAAFVATVGFLGVAIAVAEAFLRRWPRFRRWTLIAPLRTATRSRSHTAEDQTRDYDLRVLIEEFSSARHFRKIISDLIFANEEELTAGFLLADLLAAPLPPPGADPGQPDSTLRGEHHWTRLAPVFHRVFSAAAPLRSARLLARILYPEDVRTYATLFRDLALAVRQLAVSAPVEFERYRPAVGGGPPDGADGASFAAFVTAFSGSVVLADAAESRSVCAEKVLVWHSRRFHGDVSVSDMTADPSYLRGRYEHSHKDGVGCEYWGERRRRIGDFDQRVLHLRSVALAEATAENGLAIVLETSETCYGISEFGGAGMGCKGVVAEFSGADHLNDPVFFRRSTPSALPDGAQSCDYRIARENPDAGRITLLTAQLALITADDKLVLQHRASSVRHDADVIGTSAGGVISLGGMIPSGDLDDHGWPDPTAAVAREAREETGIRIEPASCQPLCVYLLNVRDAPHTRSSIPEGASLARRSCTWRGPPWTRAPSSIRPGLRLIRRAAGSSTRAW